MEASRCGGAKTAVSPPRSPRPSAVPCRLSASAGATASAACGQSKTNRANRLQKEGKIVFYNGYRQDGSLAHYVGLPDSRPGPPGAVPFPRKPLRGSAIRAPINFGNPDQLRSWLQTQPRE